MFGIVRALVVERGEIAIDGKSRIGGKHLLAVQLCRCRITGHGRGRCQEGMMELVGLADTPERLDRFRIFAGYEVSAPQMIPEALGMVRVEPHRLSDPFDAFLGPAYPSHVFAMLDDNEIVVGVEGQRAFLMILRGFVIAE